MRWLPFALPAALLALSCAPPPGSEQACTLVGCESGLEVHLDSPPAGAFRVEASAPGEASPRVQACDSAGACARIFFRDFTPEETTIRVIAGADTMSVTVKPPYETMQPNGPDCPPTCRKADVRVAVM